MPLQLFTTQGEALLHSDEIPWDIYPRPQMRRDSFMNLNGMWRLNTKDEACEIRVPFCPESVLSGFHGHFDEGETLCYRRSFTLPQEFNRGCVLLHIGAIDQKAKIYVNQILLASHVGGYDHITVDITYALQEENEIAIYCTDDLRDHSMPYGKQVVPQKQGGMWYTPITGIWQSVWLENVPEEYIEKLNIENHGYGVTISIEPKLDGEVSVPELGIFPMKDGSVTITPKNPHLWTPEDPFLYSFTITTAQDKVDSYFAIRFLDIRKNRLCLNGKPYFFHGLLDQGYWPDGLYTPPSPECYAEDILAMKKLGFNTLRKHIKVEPEEFYYQCDKLGMIVFQDMVNNGRYSFLRDTVLPTLGLQRLPDFFLHTGKKVRSEFLRQMEITVKQLRNHPCICYWTIFNEGWGQFCSNQAYLKLRQWDKSRFIDSTSGWFRHSKTDVDSRHVYFKSVKLKVRKKPLVLSEFGGYSYKVEDHIFNEEKTYGYGKYEKLAEYEAAVASLYRKQILPLAKQGLSGAIYTQISDVEDETNGLLTYDRKVCKIRAEYLGPLSKELTNL